MEYMSITQAAEKWGIKGVPYYADIKLNVVQGKNGTDSQNVVYFLEPEEIAAIKRVDVPSPTGALLERNIVFRDGTSTIETSVPQGGTVVNTQGMQDGGEYDLLANVRKKPDGEYVYSIQLNENKKKAPAPLLGRAYTSKETLNGYPQNRVLTNTYGNSIPTFGGNVNGEKYSTGRRLDE